MRVELEIVKMDDGRESPVFYPENREDLSEIMRWLDLIRSNGPEQP